MFFQKQFAIPDLVTPYSAERKAKLNNNTNCAWIKLLKVANSLRNKNLRFFPYPYHTVRPNMQLGLPIPEVLCDKPLNMVSPFSSNYLFLLTAVLIFWLLVFLFYLLTTVNLTA